MFLCNIKEVRKQGKKRIITEPLLPSFLFVHATAEQVETVIHDNKVVTNESRALLSYYFDHTIHRQDNPNCNPLSLTESSVHLSCSTYWFTIH